MKTLIKNGRVIDPSQNIDAIMDLLVEDGVIKEVAAEIKAAADEVYDADGLIVAPGLVDVHTDVTVLHPGPMNRGLEISWEVGYCDNAAIRDEVQNGVAVRMALLFLTLTGGKQIENID